MVEDKLREPFKNFSDEGENEDEWKISDYIYGNKEEENEDEWKIGDYNYGEILSKGSGIGGNINIIKEVLDFYEDYWFVRYILSEASIRHDDTTIDIIINEFVERNILTVVECYDIVFSTLFEANDVGRLRELLRRFKDVPDIIEVAMNRYSTTRNSIELIYLFIEEAGIEDYDKLFQFVVRKLNIYSSSSSRELEVIQYFVNKGASYPEGTSILYEYGKFGRFDVVETLLQSEPSLEETVLCLQYLFLDIKRYEDQVKIDPSVDKTIKLLRDYIKERDPEALVELIKEFIEESEGEDYITEEMEKYLLKLI